MSVNNPSGEDVGPHGNSNALTPIASKYVSGRVGDESSVGNGQKQDKRDQGQKLVDAAQGLNAAARHTIIANYLMVAVTIGMLVTSAAQCSFNAAQVKEMRRGSELSAAALSQSEKALNASIEASRLDQRAWVGVMAISLSAFEAGKPLAHSVRISNSGKTFAKEMSAVIFSMVVNQPPATADHIQAEADKLKLRPPSDTLPVSVLPPGGEVTFTQSSPDIVTKEIFDRIHSGESKLYLMGEIFYEDVFGEKHFTRVFSSYGAKEKAFKAERGYTNAN
jgi:hypothetical protein